ncbi:MAG: palmitoyltransferase pfa5 [Bathelium mastoideum]|nr:MAG: palmitoyltransferase pfa5 [Bathelium mastoideum]
MKNLTTIESLDRGHRTWFLAIHVSGTVMPSSGQQHPITVSYPFMPNSSETGAAEVREKYLRRPSQQPRKFAIVETRPGDNPWDLGFYRNFKSVMGDRWWDWPLPFKYSPLCDHRNMVSEFPFGPVVDRLKKQYGLLPADSHPRVNKNQQS